MIRHLGSDLPTFKSLTFTSGLNILLADKSEGATDRQSRNSAGKTSFVELIHFLFGGEVRRESIFRSDALIATTFDVTVDINREIVSVARSGAKPSRLSFNGDVSNWPLPAPLNEDAGLHELSNEAWKVTLGTLWFSLPLAWNDSERFQPSLIGRFQANFRSCAATKRLPRSCARRLVAAILVASSEKQRTFARASPSRKRAQSDCVISSKISP
jgi:hypothetical protein